MTANAPPAPAAPAQALGLGAVADAALELARASSAGRSASTLTPGAGAALKQTVLALTADARLADHHAPGPATIQVLLGQVRMGTADTELELSAGDWAPIPDAVHDLFAVTDAAVLLTVATGGS